MDGGCIVIRVFASSHGVEAGPNVAPERFRLLITLDQQTQAFPNNFVGCSIRSRGNPFLYDFFQLGRKRYIHLTNHIPASKNCQKRIPPFGTQT